MNNSLFRNGEKLSVFCDIPAVDQAVGAGGSSEQLGQLLQRLAQGRNMHRATAYLGQGRSGGRGADRVRGIREAGFHVVAVEGAGVSVALAVDMVMAAEEADVLIVVSGDAGLWPAIAAARAKGARVEVVNCPGPESAALAAAGDSSATIESVLGTGGARRSRSPDRPAPDLRRSRSGQSRSSTARGGRSSRPRSDSDGRGRSRPGDSSDRRRELEPQEWPTPPPPSPEEMGIDPATRVRPRSAGRPVGRPAPRSAEREPRRVAPPSKPDFTVLEGESLRKPSGDKDGNEDEDEGSSR
ncbi:MAG: NYN domain-containing protein [Chloroflexota bacterium]|jgi:hypothetical protein|nr:NYN domain-containing protein [Chloroflexota bacterium]